MRLRFNKDGVRNVKRRRQHDLAAVLPFIVFLRLHNFTRSDTARVSSAFESQLWLCPSEDISVIPRRASARVGFNTGGRRVRTLGRVLPSCQIGYKLLLSFRPQAVVKNSDHDINDDR